MSELDKDFSLKIRELIADEMARDLEDVTENADLTEDLNMDELDRVEVEIRIEEEFDTSFDDEDEALEEIKTVADLIRFVDRKLKNEGKEH